MAADVTYNVARAVTPSDTVEIPDGVTDALWVGGAGVVVAVLQDGKTVNFTTLAGAFLPLRVKRVNATSTTATLIVALYQR